MDDDKTMEMVKDYRAKVIEVRKAGDALQKATKDLILQCRKMGWSYRDIGDILGLSHQRIGQLMQEYGIG